MAEDKITLEVFRYHPEDDSEGRFQDYEVPYHEHWVVLDALNWIKDTVDGTLSYRWSCRMGVCGSCGMLVNGKPQLTCAAFLRNYHPKRIRVEPLSYFPVERDLMINIDDFLDKLTSIKPWLIREEDQPLEEGEYLQTPSQLAKYKPYSMCINCMLCYAACPILAAAHHLRAPAVMALAKRYNLDSRDQGAAQRQHALSADEGAWGCTFVGECTEVCPKNVDPAGAIQRAKVTNMKEWFKNFLIPRGGR